MVKVIIRELLVILGILAIIVPLSFWMANVIGFDRVKWSTRELVTASIFLGFIFLYFPYRLVRAYMGAMNKMSRGD